jgi:N-acetylmuramic acid 6-phosphate etherase
MTTPDALSLMNEGDRNAVQAVAYSIGSVATLVDAIVPRMRAGGRLIYIGAGTSGRLGVLDASEIPPTFGLESGRVVGLIAGGPKALQSAVEGLEDDRQAGAEAVGDLVLSANDVVIGLTASGNTPFTVGAVANARSAGCLTGCVTCDPGGEIVVVVEIPVVVAVGPEFIAGSTRLKAGTAQKLVLNMISTMTMVRLGYTSGNRMTNLKPGNLKLKSRAVRILAEETAISEDEAREILDTCGGDLKTAIVSKRTGRPPEDAAAALAKSGQVIQEAVETLHRED